MKKTLLTALFAFACLGANAQLANGTVAPDFTATDINGKSHTLSEYLAAGKTVIIDISATWCGPCWNYHHTGALEDIYNAYGEDGSNEVVVLFIEGDPGTSVESIYGTNTASDQSTTQGDWTIGSPYPIIDDGDGSISTAYQIAYFPTVYRICPSGTTTLIDQKTAPQIKSGINSGCATPLVGIESHAALNADKWLRVCDGEGVATAKIKNYSPSQLTAATVQLQQNNTVIATKSYTGALNQFASGTVTFDAATFDPSLVYEVQIMDVNGGAIHNEVLASEFFNVTQANTSSNNVQIDIYTDNYPGEISWDLKNSAGTTVYTGGPYQAGTGTAGAGGPDANTIKTHLVTLDEGDIDCYSIVLKDGYGDGWSLGNTQHGLQVFSGGNSVVFYPTGNFGTSVTLASAFKTTGTLSTPTVQAKKFAIYPNPTNGVLNFSTTESVDVTVLDLTGKVVFTAKNILDGGSINLNSLQKGMYIAQVKGATTQTTEKIVIN